MAPLRSKPTATGAVLIWSLFTLGCQSTSTSSDDTASPVDVWGNHPLLQDGFFNVAHRGGRRLWPEHTMLAYTNAVDAGADVLECDAHATSDGVVVCIHDTEVDRTTNGMGYVKDMTFDQLRLLDAGHRFTQDDETYPHRGTGLQVPTLDELLTAFPAVPMSIEIKQTSPSIAMDVADLLDQHDAWDRSTLMSFFDPPILEIRERQPSALTALTTLEALDLTELEADEEYAAPGQHLHAPLDFAGIVLDQTLLDRAHEHGIRVWAWTINNEADMRMLMDMGVDGIYTDDPVLLESLVE